MPSRRVDVFFYGLFMDKDLLQAEGPVPQAVEIAFVPGFALRLGQRAALAPEASARVYGVLMTLTLDELGQLYAAPSLQAYRPYAVLAHLVSGEVVPALCYNLPDPPSPAERNPEYAARLLTVARKVGLPEEYVASTLNIGR